MIKDNPDITNPRMILITGYDQHEAKEKVEQAGIDAYMLKPLKVTELSKIIEKIFKDRRVNPINTLPASSAFNFKNLKVLLVEDVKMNQELAIEILTKKDINVTLANHGEEGVKIAQKDDFDLVLMDMQMPVMDGCQATEEIRTFNRTLPIIAMTANAMTGDKNKCLAAGMNDYITKPINPEEMFKAIAKWVSYSKNLGSNGTIADQSTPGDLTQNPQTVSEPLEHHSSGISDTKPDNEPEQPPALPNSLAGIDLNEGLERCQHNTKLYLKFFADFKRDYTGAGIRLRSFAQKADLQGMKDLAHKVKGVTSNLAAKPLADIARKIETLDRITANEVAALLEEFDAELANCLASMDQVLKQSSSSEETSLNSNDLFELSELNERLSILSQRLEAQKIEAQDLALDYFSAWPIEDHKPVFKNIIEALDLFDFEKAKDFLNEISEL